MNAAVVPVGVPVGSSVAVSVAGGISVAVDTAVAVSVDSGVAVAVASASVGDAHKAREMSALLVARGGGGGTPGVAAAL